MTGLTEHTITPVDRKYSFFWLVSTLSILDVIQFFSLPQYYKFFKNWSKKKITIFEYLIKKKKIMKCFQIKYIDGNFLPRDRVPFYVSPDWKSEQLAAPQRYVVLAFAFPYLSSNAHPIRLGCYHCFWTKCLFYTLE